MAPTKARVSCASGTALLLGCLLAIWASYLHVMQDSQIEAVHASLRGVRGDLLTATQKLKVAAAEIESLKERCRALESRGDHDAAGTPAAASDAALDPATTRHQSAGDRVLALRREHPDPQPLPPVTVDDPMLAAKRKRAGYGGDASDGAHIGGWMRNDTAGWEPNLWNWMADVLGVKTFVDVGCGAGIVTKHMLDHGVDARCVEASNEAISNSFVPRDRIIQHDFTRGPWYPKEVIDVAYTVEFLEHVEPQYLDNIMALFKSARYVVMSASKQGGWSHVNVHFKWWWIEVMESYGFRYSPLMTEKVLANLTLKNFPRGCVYGPTNEDLRYSYLTYTGLVFRNPEVDFERVVLREPGDMPTRKAIFAKASRYLRECGCF